jgi:hypothetical protein
MKQIAGIIAAALLSASLAHATELTGSIGGGSGGGGGSGTVTSLATSCGVSGGPITTTGTISASLPDRVNTAASGVGADFVATDCGGVVYDNRATSVAISLPAPSTTGFGNGALFERCNINAGIATITPVSGTIGGASSYAIAAGTALNPTCMGFQSDGTNYNIVAVPPPPGLFTTTGALKGNGAGVISPAACEDLSNGAAGCSAALGSGVATAAAAALSAAGGLTSTIASGTSALGTGAITSATCATVVTTTATNAATTDVIGWGFNSDPHAVVGYIPSTSGMLTIIAYPSSGNVNFLVCNNTSGSVTPGAITLNWRVTR